MRPPCLGRDCASAAYSGKAVKRLTVVLPSHGTQLKQGVNKNGLGIGKGGMAPRNAGIQKEIVGRAVSRHPARLYSLMQQVNIGLIGSGTVGGGVYRAIQRNGPLMASRLEVRLRVARVAVRNVRKARAVKIPTALLTTDWQSVIADPSINLIGEFIGGTTTARTVVLSAFK